MKNTVYNIAFYDRIRKSEVSYFSHLVLFLQNDLILSQDRVIPGFESQDFIHLLTGT